MSDAILRNQVCALAPRNSRLALEKVKLISQPWYRAQALAWVARFTDGDPISIATLAAKAAVECDDDYKRSAVRAWEIAALAERGSKTQAKKSLDQALKTARLASPPSSRSEALLLLVNAAMAISSREAQKVTSVLTESCPPDLHWRCKRAIRDAAKIIEGTIPPRNFFWK